ncbi:MAG: type IX secretion system outer membrane channel protein PorV [Cytophagales bacterium]|nr:type IX secretion system outer membrane channel protein PorV [Cytophagales bacterium]MDW8384015.1 type IX secretion system outer membrane channel protein PorV [Flammeovirgaceae bacterium]
MNICRFSAFFWGIFYMHACAVWAQQRQVGQELIGQAEDSRPVVTAVPFLTITPDARAAGMGEAGVATSPDANATFWNPSKLAFVEGRIGVAASYTPWLQKIVQDMWIFYGSGYYRLNNQQTLGIGFRYFDLGEMQFIDANKNITAPPAFPREYAFDASYAMKLSKKFSMGVSARYIYSNLTGGISVPGADLRPGQSAAADISAYWTNPDLSLGGRPTTLSLGGSISNIGAKISYSNAAQQDFLPTNLRLGTALTTELDPFNKITFAFDINKLLVPTPPIYGIDTATGKRFILKGKDPNRSLLSGMFGSFTDAPNGFKEEMREFIWTAAGEYWYNNLFALRGGFYHESRYKGNRQYFTLGLGLRYSKFGIDVAYLIATQRQHPLEDTLRFTLLFKLDSKEAQDIESDKTSEDAF